MGRFFANFSLDRLSFWLGFVAGALFLWLLGRFLPWLKQTIQQARQAAQATRETLTAPTDVRLRNDLLRKLEGMHLTAPLFSLSEIGIRNQLIAPPAHIEPGKTGMAEDITAAALPYIPEWPEMAAMYGARTMTLPEALQGDAHIALAGELGSGKTVALAHLALQLARQKSSFANLNQMIPVWVHAADLNLPPREPANLVLTIVEALSSFTSPLTQARLPAFLTESATKGNILLLLDGLDEAPPETFKPVVEYLDQLLKAYPRLRVVAAVSPHYLDGLTELGFAPVYMAIWNQEQKARYLNRWNKLWEKYVSVEVSENERVDSTLLNAWLLSDKTPRTPLEFTLRVWAAYAGDSLGPGLKESIEAYLRRMIPGVQFSMLALEKLAVQALLAKEPFFSAKQARAWTAEYEETVQADIQIPAGIQPTEQPSKEQAVKAPASVSRLLPALIENGLIQTHSGERLNFNHPLILSYLAGVGLRKRAGIVEIPEISRWSALLHSLGFMLASGGESKIAEEFLKSNRQPLYQECLTAARWLPHDQREAPWSIQTLRQLAAIFQDRSASTGLRARAMTALAISGNATVSGLFRQKLLSQEAVERQFAALGCGYIGDTKAVDTLKELLNDRSQNVRRAACLALVAIGNKPALESVADALLGGDDDLRRMAAEALANHPEEGHPTLKEGAFLDDILVQKAVIFGLQRLREPWATEIIEKLFAEEEQWVVKDAAGQALKEMSLPNPHIPQRYPPLYNLPWLIAFAGERGMGISPGKAALEIFMLALKEGSVEQKLAAMQYVGLHGNETHILPLYNIYYEEVGELKDAAYEALLQLSLRDFELPPPAQFGLGIVR